MAVVLVATGGGMVRNLAWSWKLKASEPPWERGRMSIWEHLNDHIEPERSGLTEGGAELPDEPPFSEGTIRWAPGAEDGLFGHHMGQGDGADIVERELQALRAVLEWPSKKRMATLYELLVENHALHTADPLIERMVAQASEGALDERRLKELALWLVHGAPDREPVKIATAWLGLFGDPGLRPLFFTLGRHDEFTLFAAVALANPDADAQRDLWQLAQHAKGWGRVHVVERLRGTQDPDIRRWLLREGYQNGVMYEYTAHLAATTGGLLEALGEPSPDSELLKGAGEILSALITGQGGPAEGMEEYEDGAPATKAYLAHLSAGRGGELSHVLAVRKIQAFLEEDAADWGLRGKLGWTPELREKLDRQCEVVLARPSWRDKVIAELEARDSADYWEASEAADILGLDVWRVHMAKVKSGTLSSTAWDGAASTEDPERMASLVEAALEILDLERLGSGPAESFGFGPDHELYTAHEIVIGRLGRFPGMGWPLLEAGLQSPVVRIRNNSLRALGEWGRERWPEGVEESLQRARTTEPRADVRETIEALL